MIKIICFKSKKDNTKAQGSFRDILRYDEILEGERFMLQIIEQINSSVNSFVWGIPAMVCIIGVGLYLSIRMGFIQFRKFGYTFQVTLGRLFRKGDAADGSVTPFQAAQWELCS